MNSSNYFSEKKLYDSYDKQSRQFNRLFKFLRDNQHYKAGLDLKFNASLLYDNCSPKERIRKTYISAMNAAGGANLERSGQSCKYMDNHLNRFEHDKVIELGAFLESFAVSDFNALHRGLAEEGGLINFRRKKAAIFIRKIDWLQRNLSAKNKIFSNYKVSKIDLYIPFDSVIIFILDRLLQTKGGLDYHRDFYALNKLFLNELGEDHMLIEDIWFWGFFSTKGSTKSRELIFNEAKYYTADFIQPSPKLEAAIRKFMIMV